MPIALDHVFICCAPDAPEAAALAAVGLSEGSGNTHPGQGTANRRFFFDGGYIELLWVADPDECQSPLTSPTKLWQRWSARKSGACPFGIGFRPRGSEHPEPPFRAWAYRPGYLPPDKAILFAEGTTLDEPELFCLPWQDPQASNASQPRQPPAPLIRLLSASVGLPAHTALSASALAVHSAGLLGFHTSSNYELALQFEAHRPVVFDLRPTLGLLLWAFGDGA